MIRLGRLDYLACHELQLRLLAARIGGRIGDTVLLVEHDPVITVGRKRGAEQNLVATGEIPVVDVERGGDVTYHGPGQLVVYPIVELTGVHRDLHAWLRRLEALTIDVLAEWGLPGERSPRNTGVWIGGKKVCSIGIACRRWVTWHGLALNVSPDLSQLQRINPCGLSPDDYTSMEAELFRAPPFGVVEEAFARHLAEW